ncbi:MAG: NAD(P)/FAD-dependent oxidoreductase [Bacteroidota bacterium]
MTRKDFLRKAAIFGAASPFLASLLTSCSREGEPLDLTDGWNVNFSGNVIVIGAGAAGITAGYILNRYNIDFEVLEATANHGGRVKKIEGFADVPLDLGAEWIHTHPSVLARLRDDPAGNDQIDIVNYRPESIKYWDGSRLQNLNIGNATYAEWKFRRSTWWDYFDEFFVAQFRNRIAYNAPVVSIDYTGTRVRVTTADNTVREADKVLVTVPIGVLQAGLIEFTPRLPSAKVAAIDGMDFPPGFKASIEFSERFYPDMTARSLAGVVGGTDPELFIDGVYRKGSRRNIMNLFTVQAPAAVYSGFATEAEKLEYLIGRLDEIFDGKASATYVKHVFQDWTNEPYIRGSYSFQDGSARETLAAPVDDKIYWAGEAMAVNWSTVHGASESAYVALQEILQA